MRYITTIEGQEFTIDVNEDGRVTIDGKTLEVDFHSLPDTSLHSLIIGGQSYDIDIDIGQEEDAYRVMLKGVLYEVAVEDERTRRLAGLRGTLKESAGEVLVKAPMPGVIVRIPMEEGQSVVRGDVVAILESMKMQNEFKAPKDGVIKQIRVSPGDKIDQNTVMVTIA